ncbi:DUF4258 domain-containing protein [Lacinutrix sp. MEBiC02404]
MKIQNTESLYLSWEVTNAELNKSETLSFNHSKHSFKRANERNINHENISDVIEYGKAFFKQGLVFYVLGEHQLPDALIQKGHDKSQNIIVVIAGDSNTILTCYRSKNPFKHIKKKQKNLSIKCKNTA